MKFNYEAGFTDEFWIIEVSIKDLAGTLTASAYKDGKHFVQLRRISGEWEVYGPTPKGFYQEDIKALGEEIEKRVQTKKPG